MTFDLIIKNVRANQGKQSSELLWQWFVPDPLPPIICTLLDGLASPSVPVSPILDFVLAYQVTLIEIRKCTERGEQKIFRKSFCCGETIILNMMGFGQGWCLSCWQRWKHWIQTTWTLSAAWRDWRDPRSNMVTHKLLIDCVIRISCQDLLHHSWVIYC